MADNKIVHRVSLEGADKVSKQLESIGDVGEKSFNKVKQAADGASLGKVAESSGGFGGKTEESRLAAERLREVLHTLHPILDQVGLGVGNLGAFARVAGAGFVAFGAAIVGSVVVGLAKMAEEADRAKARLSALAGGDERGNSLFSRLSEQAKRLGGDVSDLQKPLEELVKFQQKSLVNPSVIHPTNYDSSNPNAQSAAKVRVFSGNQESPGGPPTDQTLTGAVGTLLAAAKVDRQSIQEAAGPAADFFKGLRTGGKLTPELIDSLSPTQQSTLTKALSSSTAAGGTGQQFQSPAALSQYSTTHTISAGQVLQTLSDYEPTIRKQADAVQGTTAAFEHLETSAKELAKTFGDVAHVGEGVEKFAKGIESASDAIDKFFHPQDHEPGGKKSKEEGPSAPAPFVPKNLLEVLTRGQGLHGFLTGDIPTQLSTYANFGHQGNPFGTTTDFLKKAATNPSSIQEQTRPEATNGPRSEAGPAANEPEFQPIPPPKQEFQYIPPPKNEFQYVPAPKEDQPSSQPPQQPSNTPIKFGQADQPQQVASLGSQLQSLIETISSVLNNAAAKDLNQGGRPVEGIGIRGENQPQLPQQPIDSGATSEIAQLGAAAKDAAAAAEEAAAKFRGVEPPAKTTEPQTVAAAKGGQVVRKFADGGEARLDVSPGGHLSGPGTGTSDSIDAKVSNKEFVVNAKDTANNLGLLHDINSGKVKDGRYVGGGQIHSPSDGSHFAAGGLAGPGPLTTGDYSVTFDPDTGGAYINGNLFPPGSPILDDPKIKAAIEQSKAGAKEQSPKRKHKSQFITDSSGRDAMFGAADGGLVGSDHGSSRLSSIIRGFANGRMVDFDIPHLAIGGMPEMPTPDLSSSVFDKPAASAMEHWGTIDLTTNHGDFKVATERDTMRHLSSSAQKAKRFSTGAKPSWYGGSGR